ncbi:MAG: hypothetical protein H6929_23085 [Rhodoferax sp.]|nr:hypothetical protein [Rhodoferax sp.]MCP5264253.1 hypothetical protein [Rhodoferax sp.]MCW5628165.1 hypothetical protein [Rhodoferax sp.]
MLLICSVCKAPVLRKDCHRNRYDELICRPCQATGIRFSWPRRLQHTPGKLGLAAWVVLGAMVALLLLAWLFEVMRVLQPEKLLLG